MDKGITISFSSPIRHDKTRGVAFAIERYIAFCNFDCMVRNYDDCVIIQSDSFDILNGIAGLVHMYCIYHDLECEPYEFGLNVYERKSEPEDTYKIIRVNFAKMDRNYRDVLVQLLRKRQNDLDYAVNYNIYSDYLIIITESRQVYKETETIINEFAKKNDISTISTIYAKPSEHEDVNLEIDFYKSECEFKNDDDNEMITDEFINKVTDRVLERIKSKL